VAHDRCAPLEGPFHQGMALLLALVGVEIYSKNLSYQLGRPDLNRRPLDPQDVGVGVSQVKVSSGGMRWVG
jgi:predicted alpha/beta-hydrolase family hydrolase